MKRVLAAAALLALVLGLGGTATVTAEGLTAPHAHSAILADTAWGGGCGPTCKG